MKHLSSKFISLYVIYRIYNLVETREGMCMWWSWLTLISFSFLAINANRTKNNPYRINMIIIGVLGVGISIVIILVSLSRYGKLFIF